MRLTDEDHALVAAAVTEAEAETSGEIVTIVAARSDAYHDVALHWSVLAMLLMLALLAWRPGIADALYSFAIDRWTPEVPLGGLFTVALILLALTFLLARMVFAAMPLRMALTPGATKARRVRRQALALFRASAERRTTGRTGILLYVSMLEHRAELIADEAIHARVPPERWGDAMAALIVELRQGRTGHGMAAAVREVGRVLAEQLPRAADDVNELPDRVIEL